MKRIIAALMIILMLAGCSGTPPSETAEHTNETALAAVEEFSTETYDEASMTSETISETIPESTVTTSEPEEKPEENEEEIEHPVVTPANEVYEIYPIKIIYPENQPEAANIKMETMEDTFYNYTGYTVCSFSAEYPVVSGIDEAVCKKINDEIWTYVNDIYEEEKAAAVDDRYVVHDIEFSRRGKREIEFEVDTNAGNILSFFSYYYYWDGLSAHGSEKLMTMCYDIRTGERIDINDFLTDIEAVDLRIHKAISEFVYLWGTGSPASYMDIDEYISKETADYIERKETDWYKEMTADGDIIGNSRISVKDGCLCYYLAPYEYGSYADWIRCIQVPLSDISPYLNEAGRSFLDGYKFADSEPLNVIGYKGKNYFSSDDKLDLSGITLTDGDYEFISCFESVSVDFSGSKNIDFDKLTELDNIKELTLANQGDIDFATIAKIKGLESIDLYNCDFNDISPLYGSEIKVIGGSGKNLSSAQEFAFVNAGGEYISYDLIHDDYVRFRGQDYVIPYAYNELSFSDREINDTDYEFISLISYNEDFRLEFIRCDNIDYKRLTGISGISGLELTECGNIDFAAIAEMDKITGLRLHNCDFDDISPLFGSKITSLSGEGENVSQEQADEFEKYGGWIDSDLVKGGRPTLFK